MKMITPGIQPMPGVLFLTFFDRENVGVGLRTTRQYFARHPNWMPGVF